jgi:multimeric flavodoxin WrbA
MKVVAFNGSPRKEGNTSLIIREVFKVLEKFDIETELIQIGNKVMHPCTACGKCREIQDRQCHIKNDLLNECIQKMIEADGIILGSPVYFADITPETKSLMDVTGYVTRGNGHLLARKVGAGVVALRRGGELHALNSMNNFFLINQMIIPGSSYWNLAYGKEPGDVLNDKEGIQTMQKLGENMAWLLGKINGRSVFEEHGTCRM